MICECGHHKKDHIYEEGACRPSGVICRCQKFNKKEFLKQDFWVLDGRSKTWDLKEEIKNHGGRWNADFKCWRINGITKESMAYIILKEAGLVLQLVWK